MGLFFYLDSIKSPAMENILWVPVTSLVIFFITYGLGYGPIPWALVGEMFSISVKSYASTMATSLCWAVGFILVLFFESVNESLGIHGSFWIFSFFSVSGVIFISVLLFETKGLSLLEIQARLTKSGGK